MNQSGHGPQEPCRPLDPKPRCVGPEPSAKQLGRTLLSGSAQELLGAVPSWRYVLPRDWTVGERWVPDFAGCLDLFSGQKGAAKALAMQARTWVLAFDIEEGSDQDLRDVRVQEFVFSLVNTGAAVGLGFSPPSSSFSRAVRPPWRSAAQPEGLSGLSGTAGARVAEGNLQAEFIGKTVKLCLTLNIHFWVESPYDSFLWDHPALSYLNPKSPESCFAVDMCRFNAPFRKRTRIFTNLHLRGIRMFCQGGHNHRRLQGHAPGRHCCWTEVAQTFPRRLSWWLGYAMAVDAGFLGQRRQLNAATMARQTHRRIGEAKNPGPRRARDLKYRDRIRLEDVCLVEPATEKLGLRVFALFQAWCLQELSANAWESLCQCDLTLAELVCGFGHHLYYAKQSLYSFRQFVAYLQRDNPRRRTSFGRVWQLISKWEQLEPIEHRSPMPVGVLRAMIAVAICWRWYRWAGVTLLAFFGICRPGEVLQAARDDLLLPEDLIAEAQEVIYLKVRTPKSRRRGLGRSQHAKIVDPQVVRFCASVFGSLKRGVPLFHASPSAYRRRWDVLLEALRVPAVIRLTPASLRAGGAVFAYRSNVEIHTLLWRMRLVNLETLQHYLQEVGADSIILRLPTESRRAITAASNLYDVLLTGSSP